MELQGIHLLHRVFLITFVILFTLQCVSCHVADIFLQMHLDRCLDGINHKAKPGPESDLFKQCTPWASRSCCTEQVTKDLHLDETWYNFNYSHCAPMSARCEKYHRQDLCFYECSPNVGPWLKPQKKTIRNEHFVDVPFCRSQCNLWWDACQDDQTCVVNWGDDFKWGKGGNRCPEDSTCRTFKEVYGSADAMCEKIWGNSFKVTSDDEPCMVLWFEGDVNPNDKVALMKAAELYTNSLAEKTVVLHTVLVVFMTLFTSTLINCIL